MKKLFVLVSACLFATASFAAAKKTAATKAAEPAKIQAEFIIVESSEYDAGREDSALTAGIAHFLNAEPTVTKVSYEDAQKDPKLAGLDYGFLPLYLVKKTDDVRKKMEQPLQQGFAQENDDFIILSHQTRQGVYQNKVAKPGVMEIFVMSQCPYGAMAESLVIEAQKAGKVPADKTVQLRYIVNYNDKDNSFYSMHGSGEWEEDVRQLLIAKYYPSKLWKYLEIRNKDYRSSRWDKAMEEAGINVNKITKKFDKEGLDLLKKEAHYSSEYGINASPTFLYEGKVQLDFGSASKIPGFEFLNPNAARSANNVPAGSC